MQKIRYNKDIEESLEWTMWSINEKISVVEAILQEVEKQMSGEEIETSVDSWHGKISERADFAVIFRTLKMKINP